MSTRHWATWAGLASYLVCSALPAEADVVRRQLARRFPVGPGPADWCPTQFEDTAQGLGLDNPDGAATTFTAPPAGEVEVTFLFDTSDGVRQFLDEVGVFPRAEYEAARTSGACLSYGGAGDLDGWVVPIASGPDARFFTAFPGGLAPQWDCSLIDGAPHAFGGLLDACFDLPDPAPERPAFWVSDLSFSPDGTGALAIGGPGVSDGVVPVRFSLGGLTPGVEYVVTAVWGACDSDLTLEDTLDDSPLLEVLIETPDPLPPGSCEPGEFTVCAIGRRFEITATSPRSAFAGGIGRVSPVLQGDLGGAFHFFMAEKNFQLVVKIARRTNGFYAVAIAGLESFPMTIQIRDSRTGVVKTYEKRRGKLSLPVDNQAFPVEP